MERDNTYRDAGEVNGGFATESLGDNVQINETADDRSRAERSQSAAKTNSNDDNDDNDEVDISCGIWKIRTSVFGRKFSNLYVFITCVGLSTFFTILVQSTFQVQLTSMQKQFGIDNAQTGLFETASRIGSLSTILFAGHFAKKTHIPVVVGLAGVIQGLIFMVPALIQIFDPYTLPVLTKSGSGSNLTNATGSSENDQYLCNAVITVNGSVVNTTFPTVPTTDKTNRMVFNILIAIQAIKGITDAFHAGFLPTLYVDDNTLDKTKMGLIFGIQSLISTLAYPIGKQINAFISKVPIDLKDTIMDPQDERFVAAWWLPFLAFGALTVLFSVPILLFPRKLVSQRQQVEALKKAMVSFANVGEEAPDIVVTDDANDKELGKENERASTKRDNSPTPARRYSKHNLSPRISNPSGFLDTTSQVNRRRSSLVPPLQGPSERRISIDGKVIFDQPIRERASVAGGESIQGSSNLKELLKDFPKAIYRIFRRPVFSLFIIDIFIASIPMAGLAMFRTVYVTNEYNVSMADAATLTAVTQIVGQLLGTFLSGYLAKKVTSKMGFVYILIGTHLASLIVTPVYLILTCDNEVVYGHTGDYGMPVNTSATCGCNGQLLSCGDDGNNYLSPCYAGCLDFDEKKFTMCSGLGNLNTTMNLLPGLCPTNCRTNYVIYVVLHAVQSLLWSMSSIPGQLLILRMVDPKDRGFATSVFAFCSTVASIPAPNIFGKVIDGTCLIWKGSFCPLYDRDQIRYLLSGADIAVSASIQFTIFLTVYFFRKEERELKEKIREENKNKKKEESSAVNIKL